MARYSKCLAKICGRAKDEQIISKAVDRHDINIATF